MRPVVLSWGPFTVYSYGLMMAVGFLMFLAYIRREARRDGMDPETLTNTAFAALVGGIVGARALFVALDWGYFAERPWDVFLLNRGGLVWYGGFAGGVAAAWLHARHRRLNVGRVFDIFTPPLALAQAIGRIGCFLNGCCYGFEAHPPAGVCLPDGLGCRFPVQLLNTLLLTALFLVLHACHRRSVRPGGLLWIYGLGYGIIRFSTEFFRGDQSAVWLGLSLPQLLSAALAAVSAAVLFIRRTPKGIHS
jgi:phosphatidylglycerol:prolipoprotein diacylglycerol transferase